MIRYENRFIRKYYFSFVYLRSVISISSSQRTIIIIVITNPLTHILLYMTPLHAHLCNIYCTAYLNKVVFSQRLESTTFVLDLSTPY